jgi:16S rRNA (uracil1498-N3)-methyltransferase
MPPRLYSPSILAGTGHIVVDPTGARHLREALRMRQGEALIVFDGLGGEYQAVIESLDRQQVVLRLGAHLAVSRESPLPVTLAQGISRGERMDYTIQKAVELGVTHLVPLATERSTVRLDDERARKRGEHWQGIIRHAAEQSGRTALPLLADVIPVSALPVHAFVVPPTSPESVISAQAGIQQAIDTPSRDAYPPLRLLLDPGAEQSLATLPIASAVCLAVGPEGGFSSGERTLLMAAGFQRVRLGPRVFRTETAALVALALLQARMGDLG